VHARGNHPMGGRHVWEENALAQKNLTIVKVKPGAWVLVPVRVGHLTTVAAKLTLELRRPKGSADLEASIFEGTKETAIPLGEKASIEVAAGVGFPLPLGLKLQAPKTGAALYDLVQLDANKRPVGGIAVMVVVTP